MSGRDAEPLTFDPSRALSSGGPITREALAALSPRLIAAREALLADLELWHTGGEIPLERRPLDPGFVDLPDRLLQDYRVDRSRGDNRSELGRVLSVARHLADEADRVVVLAGDSRLAAQAVVEACSHPWHNELSRADRGSHPRLYFAADDFDNDATQGLLDLVGRPRPALDVEQRFALMVVESHRDGSPEVEAALRQFLPALRRVAGDDRLAARLLVPIQVAAAPKVELADNWTSPERFELRQSSGGRFAAFTAAGLLPAALVGLDLMRLLLGAATMTEVFREAPVDENPVLRYAGICHLLGHGRPRTLRVTSRQLHVLQAWHAQLSAESLGQGSGTVASLATNLIVDHPRRDRLACGIGVSRYDAFPELAGRTLVDLAAASHCPDQDASLDLHLPRPDESSLGQLVQMLMLATVIEGYLSEVNPYADPAEGRHARLKQALAQPTVVRSASLAQETTS